jgi:HEAT repeat protein
MLNRVMSVREPSMRAAVRKFVQPDGRPLLIGAALNVLSIQQDRGSIPTVRKLYEDERAGVVAMAAAWLIRLSENEGDVLVAALATGEVEYREFSRVYNLLYSAPAVPPVVLQAITDLLETEENSSVLSSALRLLARTRYRKAVPAIRRLLKHGNSAVSKSAFETLLALDGGLDRESLTPLLASKDPKRRLMGADGLRRLNDHVGLKVVLEVLADGEPTDRAEAARVLGGFRIAAAVDPLLDALADGHSTVRMQASYALSAVLSSLFPYRRIDLKSTGYEYAATPAANREAIRRLRAFWETHRDGDW